MEPELWAKLAEEKHSTIDGRGIWMYLLDTSIGEFYAVEWERHDRSLERKVFDNYREAAEKLYFRQLAKMAGGKG